MKTASQIKMEVMKSMGTNFSDNLAYWTNCVGTSTVWTTSNACSSGDYVAFKTEYLNEPVKQKENNKLCLCTKHLWS
jgi:hypothetical protein